MLGLLTAINLFNYMDRYIMAAIQEQLGEELSLSDSQIGTLTFAFVVVYMLTSPFFGFLADKLPGRRPLLIALGVSLWSLATAGAAFVQSYPMLLFTRSLVGVGEASYASLGPAILSDIYPEEKRAQKFTLFYMAIPVGSALGYGIGGLVAGWYGWRTAFLVAGLPGLILAAFASRQTDPPRGAMDVEPDRALGKSFGQKIGMLFSNRIWVVCTISYTAYTFAMGGLSTWGPSYLQRNYQVSTADAGLTFGIFAVVTGLLGTFLGGWFTDYFARQGVKSAGVWVSGLTLLISAPVVAIALTVRDLYMTYVFLFLGMLFLFFNTGPMNALLVSCLPASIRATGVAMNVLIIHLLGDAISPQLVGARADSLGGDGEALGNALMMVVPAIAISASVLWWARDKKVPPNPEASTTTSDNPYYDTEEVSYQRQ